jgi:signal transduction histidine kinase
MREIANNLAHIGVLKVINKTPDQPPFDNDDLDLFQTFASQISIALVMSEGNRALFKLVQGVGHEIENSALLERPLALAAKESLESFEATLATSSVIKTEDLESLNLVKEILDTICTAAEEAKDFTQDLLGFSGRKFQKREPVNLNALIKNETLKLKQSPPPSVINAGQVDVNFEFSDEQLMCNIYEIPFMHVVRNIVANAFQAMEGKQENVLSIKTYRKRMQKEQPERELTYTTRKTGEKHLNVKSVRPKIETIEKAFIEFTDTGSGIEEADINHIFDSRFSKRAGGNGLGLWLVKLSLQRMNGIISVQSELGKGSTFTIELPIPNVKSRGNDEQTEKSSSH